jgi:hypothetical protein
MAKHHKPLTPTQPGLPIIPSESLSKQGRSLPSVYNNNFPDGQFTLVNDTDSNIVNNYVGEAINIAGAPVNVFKLLGIYEQSKLIDLTGEGQPISSGSYNAFPPSNAFDRTTSEWRTVQKGGECITDISYIGYDFGPIRLNNGRVRYGIDTAIKHEITTIILTQGCDSKNRISKARVERSPDNKVWYGVDIIDIPDVSGPLQFRIKQSAPARYWRLRPLAFNGGPEDFWAVVSLELIDFNSLTLQDVQDELGFLENRDRVYANQSILIKAYYQIVDPMLEVGKFGGHIADTQTWILEVAFSATTNALGRPLIIGDILEIPSETQYTPLLKPVKKYLEVQDVAWATDGFTPGWVPTLQRISAVPAIASQETMAIFGDLNLPTQFNDFANTVDNVYNVEAQFQDQRVRAAANTEVPERGEDIANVEQISLEQIAAAEEKFPGINLGKLNYDPRGLYVQDGMPPNGESFTEGPKFPPSPKDKAWHRLTSDPSLKEKVPTLLYRYSTLKGRWLFYEQDKRELYNVTTNPALTNILTKPNIPLNKVGQAPSAVPVMPKKP